MCQWELRIGEEDILWKRTHLLGFDPPLSSRMAGGNARRENVGRTQRPGDFANGQALAAKTAASGRQTIPVISRQPSGRNLLQNKHTHSSNDERLHFHLPACIGFQLRYP